MGRTADKEAMKQSMKEPYLGQRSLHYAWTPLTSRFPNKDFLTRRRF